MYDPANRAGVILYPHDFDAKWIILPKRSREYIISHLHDNNFLDLSIEHLMMVLDNAAPQIFNKAQDRILAKSDWDDQVDDPVDAREIFDLIRGIKDPEHPLTLEELNVVREDQIDVNLKDRVISIEFTPTINRCSMAPLIGLSIIVKLLRSLPDQMKVDVKISSGTHDAEEAYNKQLNDKERVAAALENSNLLSVINACMYV